MYEEKKQAQGASERANEQKKKMNRLNCDDDEYQILIHH